MTGAGSRKIKDRIKDGRLRGSDLYVARLCWKEAGDDQPMKQAGSLVKPSKTESLGEDHNAISTDSEAGPAVPSPTGSLHDELQFCIPKAKDHNVQPLQSRQKQRMATQSRPCYRCISYMHSAGIKRVFWTNAKGDWEGAKVQELVDALESSGKEEAGGSVKTLFVTKHEVLMLRRSMGSL